MRKAAGKQTVIYTIGHSTRPQGEFIKILRSYEIKTLVDIRTIPKSRHNPQFNKDSLEDALRDEAIRYVHMAGLGGLRRVKKDSPNSAWKNASFRGFADYMQSEEFSESLRQLILLAEKDTVAIMCAEAVPWRCHRSLVGDALLARGLGVKDIFSETEARDHTLTPWARVEGTNVTYPATSS